MTPLELILLVALVLSALTHAGMWWALVQWREAIENRALDVQVMMRRGDRQARWAAELHDLVRELIPFLHESKQVMARRALTRAMRQSGPTPLESLQQDERGA